METIKRGRQPLTDKEKQSVIDAHIREYRAQVLNTESKQAQWDKLPLAKQYNRMKGYIQRKNAKGVTNANDIASRLAHIDGMPTNELKELSNDLQEYLQQIESAIKANRQKEIERKENEINEYRKQSEMRLQELQKELETLQSMK